MNSHTITDDEWKGLTLEQKNHVLFLREKEMMDVLLSHGAIALAQHHKRLRNLMEKMGGVGTIIENRIVLAFLIKRGYDAFRDLVVWFPLSSPSFEGKRRMDKLSFFFILYSVRDNTPQLC